MKQIIYIFFFAILLTGCSASKQTAQRKSEKETKELIKFAHSYIGAPYSKELDCSKFVQLSYQHIGYSLPRSSKEQAKTGTNVEKKNLITGDLVFFKGKNEKSKEVGHVGIVTESNKKGEFNFIHASTSAGVRIDNSELNYYKIRYVKARRIIGTQ